MFQRIYNNFKYDITGNFSNIMENAGGYRAIKYLSVKSVKLFCAIVFNKTKRLHNVEFYDTWD